MARSSAPTRRSTVQQDSTDPRDLRHQALADVRRQSVLDAARATFVELGMEKTSMRLIAQRAGYTVGALYSYFASKEEEYDYEIDRNGRRWTGLRIRPNACVVRPRRSSASTARTRAISISASTCSRA